MGEAADSFERDQGRDNQQGDAVDRRCEDLGTLETKGPPSTRGPPRQRRCPHRPGQRTGVSEHVARVRQQRKRVGEERDDDLDSHEAREEGQRRAQVAAVGAGRHPVPMAAVPPVVMARLVATGARRMG